MGLEITHSMICAGYDQGGKDTCRGDSGGPLSIIKNGVRLLIGITSWGYECGRPYFPGVYASVSAIRPWIKNVTGI